MNDSKGNENEPGIQDFWMLETGPTDSSRRSDLICYEIPLANRRARFRR
jgi:hypothetical protein